MRQTWFYWHLIKKHYLLISKNILKNLVTLGGICNKSTIFADIVY